MTATKYDNTRTVVLKSSLWASRGTWLSALGNWLPHQIALLSSSEDFLTWERNMYSHWKKGLNILFRVQRTPMFTVVP